MQFLYSVDIAIKGEFSIEKNLLDGIHHSHNNSIKIAVWTVTLISISFS